MLVLANKIVGCHWMSANSINDWIFAEVCYLNFL